MTLSVSNVSATGLTYVFDQRGGIIDGTLSTGSDYHINRYQDNQWTAIPYLPLPEGTARTWTAEGYPIDLEATTKWPQWSCSWIGLYGDLPPGDYRIGKAVTVLIAPGEYDQQVYYATFTIE